jgi:uncharacterized protein (DUF1697 family)
MSYSDCEMRGHCCKAAMGFLLRPREAWSGLPPKSRTLSSISSDFVLLRTEAEMRTIVEENPFAQRQGLDFSKLAVFFLPGKITPDSRTALQAIRSAPDEFYAGERELFVYYPNGFSKAVLTQGMLDRALNGVKGTARNWNTVLKLLAMAGEEAAAKP